VGGTDHRELSKHIWVKTGCGSYRQAAEGLILLISDPAYSVALMLRCEQQNIRSVLRALCYLTKVVSSGLAVFRGSIKFNVAYDQMLLVRD
jgi:hypothetical protein